MTYEHQVEVGLGGQRRRRKEEDVYCHLGCHHLSDPW